MKGPVSESQRALDAMKAVSAGLRAMGIEDAEKEVELFITEGLGIGRVQLYRDNPKLSAAEALMLNEMLRRRQRREPLQYIIGHVEFCGLKIRVGPGVLIPRPESELLAEEAVARLSDRPSPRVLELCTGSGCVALSVARGLPRSEVTATDTSGDALRYAGENARLNRIGNVRFLKGSLFGPVAGERFDAVLANPPYIRTEDIDGLAPEIRLWEPRAALDGGADGLDFYREIIASAGEHLNPGGMLIVETGGPLAGPVADMARAAGLSPEAPTRDYGGCDRIITMLAGRGPADAGKCRG